jgi:hypothetical protein
VAATSISIYQATHTINHVSGFVFGEDLLDCKESYLQKEVELFGHFHG